MTSMTRADLTRRRLLDQARLAFAERGYDGVSVKRDVLGPIGLKHDEPTIGVYRKRLSALAAAASSLVH